MIKEYSNKPYPTSSATISANDSDTDTDTDTIDEEISITEEDPIDKHSSENSNSENSDFRRIPYREFNINETYTFSNPRQNPKFYIINPKNLSDHFNKAKPIVKQLVQHLNLNIDLAAPIYINGANGVQNEMIQIDFINIDFCNQISGYNSFLIYYKDELETILIYHPKWNIILNKTYSNYSIQIYSYSNEILRQESINYINSITYKQNGMVLEKKPYGCEIILPSSIRRKRTKSVLDCFIVWKTM